MSSRQRGIKPQRKNAGGRKSEQHPYHPHPKPSSVQSAVGGAHQESVSTATNEHARIDHQPSQQSSSARNEPSSKCDKSRALRNVVTHLTLLVHSISVTMITFQGHSKVKQLRKFKVAYFGKCLPIQFKWQYPHLTPSVPHAQTLHRHRNNTD